MLSISEWCYCRLVEMGVFCLWWVGVDWFVIVVVGWEKLIGEVESVVLGIGWCCCIYLEDQYLIDEVVGGDIEWFDYVEVEFCLFDSQVYW